MFSTNELDGRIDTYRLDVSGTLTLMDSILMMPAGFHTSRGGADNS